MNCSILNDLIIIIISCSERVNESELRFTNNKQKGFSSQPEERMGANTSAHPINTTLHIYEIIFLENS